MTRAAEVYDFWFGGMDANGAVSEETRKRWFTADPAFDAEIARRFGDLLEEAAAGGLADWEEHSLLPLILVLDQFTRNVWRSEARTFSLDPRAQQVTIRAIESGCDTGLLPPERQFLYLPLMHAEDQVLQLRSVKCYTQLARDVAPGEELIYDNVLEFAVKHKAIVDKFGRFPHRNEVLGRVSTAEELAFLEKEGRGF